MPCPLNESSSQILMPISSSNY